MHHYTLVFVLSLFSVTFAQGGPSLDDNSGSPGVYTLPDALTLPGLTCVSGLHGVPGVPGVNCVPGVPGAPGAPTLPGAFGPGVFGPGGEDDVLRGKPCRSVLNCGTGFLYCIDDICQEKQAGRDCVGAGSIYTGGMSCCPPMANPHKANTPCN